LCRAYDSTQVRRYPKKTKSDATPISKTSLVAGERDEVVEQPNREHQAGAGEQDRLRANACQDAEETERCGGDRDAAEERRGRPCQRSARGRATCEGRSRAAERISASENTNRTLLERIEAWAEDVHLTVCAAGLP
jgi:hypothetical protein